MSTTSRSTMWREATRGDTRDCTRSVQGALTEEKINNLVCLLSHNVCPLTFFALTTFFGSRCSFSPFIDHLNTPSSDIHRCLLPPLYLACHLLTPGSYERLGSGQPAPLYHAVTLRLEYFIDTTAPDPIGKMTFDTERLSSSYLYVIIHTAL